MNVTAFWEESVAESAITWPNIGGRGADEGDTVFRCNDVEIDGDMERGIDWYGGIVVSKRDNGIRLYIGHEHWADPCWAGTETYETVRDAMDVFEATITDIEENGSKA